MRHQNDKFARRFGDGVTTSRPNRVAISVPLSLWKARTASRAPGIWLLWRRFLAGAPNLPCATQWRDRLSLRDLPLFRRLPEIRGQSAIIVGEDLIHGPLGAFGRFEARFLVLGGLPLVFLHFALEIGIH